MNSRPSIVVVGGGVIGLSTAYHLAKRRVGNIILLEKGRLGEGASSRAAGITTGLMWSEPGVLLRQKGIELFAELSAELDGYHYHNQHGCLNLFDPEQWVIRETLLPLYDRLGIPYAVLSGQDIQRRWPALSPPEHYIGLHDPRGGFSEPADYLSALEKKVRQLGVDIREEEKLTDFIVRQDRISGVTTRRDRIEAEAVVATVNVWGLPVLRALGLQYPTKQFVHQRYLTRPLPEPIGVPPVNANPCGGYFRPAQGNRLLLGIETSDREEWRVDSTEFNMNDVKAPPDLLKNSIDRFTPFLPAFGSVQWETEHAGLISFSRDGEPILGPVGRLPGLFAGFAFHSGGFSYNTIAGLLLAEFVSEGKTSIDVRAFSPDRFDPEQTEHYLNTTVRQRDAVSRRH